MCVDLKYRHLIRGYFHVTLTYSGMHLSCETHWVEERRFWLNCIAINFSKMINKLNFFYQPWSVLHPPIYVIIYFIDPKSLRTMTEEQKIIYSNQSLFTFPTLLLKILQREGNRRISVNEQSIAISYFALVSGYGYLHMLLMKVSKFLIETRARTHALSSCAYWKSQWFP